MVRKLGFALALCTAAGTSLGGSHIVDLPAQTQRVSLHAIVTAGMTSSCGFREAPHLIEHMLLSDTKHGESPVDAMISLRKHGVILKAYTRLDHTHFQLSGPSDKAQLMSDALVDFLGKSSLPSLGFEREKSAILSELSASSEYVSRGSFFERFIDIHGDGPPACQSDAKPFVLYEHSEMDKLYRELYTADRIYIAAEGQPGLFDLDGIREAIISGKTVEAIETASASKRSDTLAVHAPTGVFEVIFPIPGRGTLPSDAAEAMADSMRLEVQAYIRRELSLYSARTFVDQGISAGWIRLEVPRLPNKHTNQVVNIAINAARNVEASHYGSDVIWQLMGSEPRHFQDLTPIVATQQSKPYGYVDWIADKLRILLDFFSK